MSLVFPVLLGGLALAAIPVLLHLIMRQKPRTLLFPAFRFLVQRHRQNLRKLKLRHLLLLALRVLLIAAICFALTRPRLYHKGLGLSSDRPVAAVLIFDTSPSMDYKTSDGVSRLDEAKKRGLEFLGELPEGSRIVVLDSSAAAASARGDWASKHQARERIGGLKVASVAGSVSPSLEYAYRVLGDLGRSAEDDAGRFLPRLVCVFSDRARAAWDMSRQDAVLKTSDETPPALEGLSQARDTIGPLKNQLQELRRVLPPSPGKDYPDQALLDFLDQLRDRLPSLTKDDMPPEKKLADLLANIQSRSRELLAQLQTQDLSDKQASDFRDRLAKSLQDLLGNLRGAAGIFFDVGVEAPLDLALVQLDLPKLPSGLARQLFAEDEKFVLNAVVRATGKDFSTTLLCKFDKKTLQQAVEIKDGETKTIPFEIDLNEVKLGPGQHQLEVRFATQDLLAFDNQRFLTFAVREPQRVLVIVDEPGKASYLQDALRALRFVVDVKTPAEALKEGLVEHRAVFLFEVQSPPDDLWVRLEKEYVAKGGSLAIVPGGDEMKLDAYNSGLGQKLMPGTFWEKVSPASGAKGKGAKWNFGQDSIYQHPLLAPIRTYPPNTDFLVDPSNAFTFWETRPHPKEGAVLVYYQGAKKYPALLERRLSGDNGQAGKIILFTTTLDSRKPRWNDYLEDKTSFFVSIIGLATRYLVGEAEALQLNFTSGQGDPVVNLPLDSSAAAYSLVGPGTIEPISAPEGNRLAIRQAAAPGNYVLERSGSDVKLGRRVAAFSVNLPGEESDLSRVPAAEIEAVFGLSSLLANDRKADIRSMLTGHWSEPIELFPLLMVVVLLALALENLLANKFYRRDNLEEAQGKSPAA